MSVNSTHERAMDFFIPSKRDSSQRNAIALDDQEVGNFGILHGILLIPSGLFHAQTPYEDGESGNDTQAKGDTPDSTEVVVAEAEGGKYELDIWLSKNWRSLLTSSRVQEEQTQRRQSQSRS